MVCVCFIAGWILGLVLLLLPLYIYVKVSMGRFNSEQRMDGKTVIITGANSGIGYASALDLAGRGARVIMACRNQRKANEARDKIIAATRNNNVHVRLVDMVSFTSVRKFASEILATEERIDVLMNNAGAEGLGTTKTEDGFLPGIQCNHYSPFLLTNLLLGRLKESAPSRVVFVASTTHLVAFSFNVDDISQDQRKTHCDLQTYANSKLLNVLASNELARRMKGTGVTSNSLCPGGVNTEFWSKHPTFNVILINTIGLFFKNASEGAQTQIRLSVDPQLENITGKYFKDCAESRSSSKAKDSALAKKAWDLCEKAVQLKESEKYYNK